MLVIQVLVTLLLGVGDFGIPSTFLHYSFRPENVIFVMVVSIDTVLILDQMSIVDFPPAVTITNTGGYSR